MASLMMHILFIAGVWMASTVYVPYVGLPPKSSSIMNIFYCNAGGLGLQWEINSNIIAFTLEDPRRLVNVRSGMASGCHYIAVLQPSNELFILESLLFVYNCTNDSKIEVTCWNNSDSDGVCARERSGFQSVPLATNYSDTVSLDYLYTKAIPGLNRSTSVFLCTVNHDFMTWKVNNGTPKGFSIKDSTGADIPFQSENVMGVGVMYDKESSKIYSILSVTHSDDITVMCASTSRHVVSLLAAISHCISGDDKANETTGTVVPVTTDSLVKRTSNYRFGVGAIIGIIIIVVLCAFFGHVPIAGIVSVLYYCRLGCPCLKRWKNNRDQQSDLPRFQKKIKNKVDSPDLSKSNDAAITFSEKNLDGIRAYSA